MEKKKSVPAEQKRKLCNLNPEAPTWELQREKEGMDNILGNWDKEEDTKSLRKSPRKM